MAGEGSCSGRAIGGSSSQGGKTSGDTGWRQPQEIKEEIQKLDSDWGPSNWEEKLLWTQIEDSLNANWGCKMQRQMLTNTMHINSTTSCEVNGV